ncbi:MAG: hypothetical protein ABIO45_00085 [Burkholderiaceae bacterium]
MHRDAARVQHGEGMALAAAGASRIDLLTPRIGEWVDADRQFASTPWVATASATTK